ncbi:MAG: hypothetical protein JNL93_25605 [Pelomonas sp.]|nr:hypothetical protein [Roseateles sp.]
MNAVAQTFAIAFGSVAAAAAIGVGLADHATQPTGQVERLERVVIVGQRAPDAVVAKLPRVVVEHRRAPASVTVAQADASPAL